MFTFLASAARAQVGCGGEGQSVCTVGDNEFYSNNNYSGCQYDLHADGGFLSNLVGDSSCVNQQRYSLSKQMTAQMNWDAWALSEQRNGIGRNEQLNWITTLGTHNSYSNSHQGYTRSLGQNQVYSITDQLNAGARILELDPHTYYQAVNGGHLTVCHGSPVQELGVTVDTADGACILTSPTYAREFQAVLGEIAYWMKSNPSQVLILFIDVGGPTDNYISGHEQDLENDVVNVLGANNVWSVPDTVQNGGHVPSIAQMQAKGRSVILISNKYLAIRHVHTFDLAGDLPVIDPGVFPSNNFDQSNFTATNCQDGDGKNPLLRGRDAWFRLGEGRSGSDWLSSGSSQPLINESEVQAATSCAASYVELDFLYARDQVPTSGYQQSGQDLRYDNGVWSWKSGDYGQHGPAMMQGGRWVSTPTIDSSGNPVLQKAACMKIDPAASSYAQRKTWVLTNFPTSFANAGARCAIDHPGYSFSAPVNGYENQVVSRLGDNIWLNYQSKNLGDPYASPTVMTFQFPQGSAPAAQTFQIIGQPNKVVNLTNQLAETPLFLFDGQASETLRLNGNGSAIVSVSILTPQSMVPDLYVQFVRMHYIDGTGQASTLGFQAFVQIAPSITLNPPSVTKILQGTQWTPTVTMNINPQNNTTLGLTTAAGTVSLVEQLVDLQGKPYTNQLLTTNINLPSIDQPFTIQFSTPLSLSPGTHNILAVYQPSSSTAFHSRVASNIVVMTVAPEMTFSAPQVNFNIVAGAASVPPQIVTVSGAKGALSLQKLSANWVSASVSQQKITFNLTSAAKLLKAGVYTFNVGVTDLTTKYTDTLKVTLSVQGNLVSSVASLSLAASSGTATAPVSVIATGDGNLPLDIETPSWMTWSSTSTTTPTAIVFTAKVGTNTVGTHLKGTIHIKSTDASNTISIPVDFYVVLPTVIEGSGLSQPTVLFDGARLELPASLPLVPGSQHKLDASGILFEAGHTGQRWVFQSWNDGSPAVFSFTAAAGTTPVKYAVTFAEQDLLSLTVTPSKGGSVTVQPSSSSGFYPKGAKVTLTATPSQGYTFLSYSGGVTSTKGVISIPIVAPASITATFKASTAK